jgi:hypothetical protein
MDLLVLAHEQNLGMDILALWYSTGNGNGNCQKVSRDYTISLSLVSLGVVLKKKNFSDFGPSELRF